MPRRRSSHQASTGSAAKPPGRTMTAIYGLTRDRRRQVPVPAADLLQLWEAVAKAKDRLFVAGGATS